MHAGMHACLTACLHICICSMLQCTQHRALMDCLGMTFSGNHVFSQPYLQVMFILGLIMSLPETTSFPFFWSAGCARCRFARLGHARLPRLPELSLQRSEICQVSWTAIPPAPPARPPPPIPKVYRRHWNDLSMELFLLDLCFRTNILLNGVCVCVLYHSYGWNTDSCGLMVKFPHGRWFAISFDNIPVSFCVETPTGHFGPSFGPPTGNASTSLTKVCQKVRQRIQNCGAESNRRQREWAMGGFHRCSRTAIKTMKSYQTCGCSCCVSLAGSSVSDSEGICPPQLYSTMRLSCLNKKAHPHKGPWSGTFFLLTHLHELVPQWPSVNNRKVSVHLPCCNTCWCMIPYQFLVCLEKKILYDQGWFNQVASGIEPSRLCEYVAVAGAARQLAKTLWACPRKLPVAENAWEQHCLWTSRWTCCYSLPSHVCLQPSSRCKLVWTFDKANVREASLKCIEAWSPFSQTMIFCHTLHPAGFGATRIRSWTCHNALSSWWYVLKFALMVLLWMMLLTKAGSGKM